MERYTWRVSCPGDRQDLYFQCSLLAYWMGSHHLSQYEMAGNFESIAKEYGQIVSNKIFGHTDRVNISDPFSQSQTELSSCCV